MSYTSRRMWKDVLQQRIAAYHHPAWGLSHSLRVYHLALWLSSERGKPVDVDTLLAAAYLHDLGAMADFRDPAVEHATRSVQLLDALLPSDFPAAKRPLLEAVILGHPYQQRPQGPEDVLVFHDADALDFMGAVGVVRLLAIAGIETWWVPDVRRAIALIERFAYEMPQNLLTPQAQRIGSLRQAEMLAFLEHLRGETQNLEAL